MTEKLRSFEIGGGAKNPKNGFDLFACKHHGHRVTSHECGDYKKSGACPALCVKYPGPDSVGAENFPPSQNNGSPEPQKIEPELFPVGRPFKGRNIYFSRQPAGDVTHRICHKCGIIKEINDQNFYIYEHHTEPTCRPCIKIRDKNRRIKLAKLAHAADHIEKPSEADPGEIDIKINPGQDLNVFIGIADAIKMAVANLGKFSKIIITIDMAA